MTSRLDNLREFLRREYERSIDDTNAVNYEYGYKPIDENLEQYLLIEQNTHMGSSDLLMSTYATEAELCNAIRGIIWEAEDPDFIVRDTIDLDTMESLDVQVEIHILRPERRVDLTDADHVDRASDEARDEM